MTSDQPWDPSILSDERAEKHSSLFEEFQDIIMDETLPDEDEEVLAYIKNVRQHPVMKVKEDPPDWEKVQHCLGYLPLEVIKKTYANTTQMAKNYLQIAI